MIRNRTPQITLKWLTVRDVAEDLELSRQQVTNKLSANGIPGGEMLYETSTGKRRWRILADEYWQWRAEARASTPVRPTLRPFVYFVQERDNPSGPVKIGSSSNLYLQARLAALQTGNPRPLHVLAVLDGGQELEFSLHRQFAESRLHGEWFTFSAGLRAMVDDARRTKLTNEGSCR